MFDTLPEAVDYAKRLHSRGKVSLAEPAEIGYRREGSKVIWYVLPWRAEWPSPDYIPTTTYPTGLD